MTDYARCPQCGASDGLVLTEVYELFGQTDPGRHEVRAGVIIPAGDFVFNPGDPVRVEMECNGCGHCWRSRRTVGVRL